jgi:hypothetical protein
MSEIGAGILIIILVVALAVITYIAIFGTINLDSFKKTTYIAGTAAAADVPLSGKPQILTYLPRAGDPFHFSGQSDTRSGTNVTLKLISPEGQIIYPNMTGIAGNPYGRTLFIYPKISPSATQCDYVASETMPSGTYRPMVTGVWTLDMIDTGIPFLIDSYKVGIAQGRVSLPSACGFIGSGSQPFYRSDCTALNQTVTGPAAACSNSPGNMPCTTFNRSTFVTVPNDPSLSFTGNNLALSVWIKPIRASSSISDTSNWYTILGKGQIVGGVENDNYQLVQIGNKIYFEWTDPATGTHYHVMTSSSPLQAGQWTQVTVSITNGKLKVYTNCVEQPINYYRSNYPSDTTTVSAVDVNLAVNANNFLVGKQNSDTPANSFYFDGDMAGISIYDRGLTAPELAATCAGNYLC